MLRLWVIFSVMVKTLFVKKLMKLTLTSYWLTLKKWLAQQSLTKDLAVVGWCPGLGHGVWGPAVRMTVQSFPWVLVQSKASRWSWWFKFDPILRYWAPSPAHCLSTYFCLCQVSWRSSTRPVQAGIGSLSLVDFPISYLQAAWCLIWLVYFWLLAFKDTASESMCVCVRVCVRQS